MWQPNNFNEFIGNTAIKDFIVKSIKENNLSKTLMFMGLPGTGKTTLANLIAKELDAHKSYFNIANLSGVDNVRENILSQLNVITWDGKTRVFILDEIQKMSNAAQQALLEIEKIHTKENIYFIACTTELDKIIKPLKERFDVYVLNTLSKDELKILINVLQKKIGQLKPNILKYFKKICNKIPRTVVKLYERLLKVDTLKEAKALTVVEASQKNAIDIVKNLSDIEKYKGEWKSLYSLFVVYYSKVFTTKGKKINPEWFIQKEPELYKAACRWILEDIKERL